MKRLVLLTAILAPVMALALIAGCGSSKSTSPDLVQGDTTAAEFQFAQEFLGGSAMSSIASTLDLTFMLWDSIPGVSSSPRDHWHSMAAQTDSLSLSYDYSNGWHVFNFEGYMADAYDTVVMIGVDSVRFLSNGVPMQVPDSTADALDIRPHFSMEAYVNGSHISSDQMLSITNLSTDPMQPVTINGSSVEAATLIFGDTAAACTLSMATNLAIHNLVTLLEGDDCPSSGSLSAGATVDMSCVGDGDNSVDVNGMWHLTANFTGTTVEMQYSNATTVWNVTEPCGGVVAKLNPWIFPQQ